MGRYIKGLLHEIAVRGPFFMRALAEGGAGAGPDTLYFGGGTPSLFPEESLGTILAAIRSVRRGQGLGDREFQEFTVEVNPDDVTDAYALALRRLGVGRVSMGVQSFHDRSLRWMNRRHDAAGAVEAFRRLRSAGFDNISLDLIFGYDPAPWGSRPTDGKELLRLWEEDLSRMVELRPEHISAYQMGVEEDSVLGQKAAAGLYREPDEEVCAAQYALLQEVLSQAGYEQYEVSNFALPGRRALHNSGYWDRYPYIGLGPGAHSFDGRRRYWNHPDTDAYAASWNGETESRPSEEEELTAEDIAVETVMLGLRKAEGLRVLDGYRVTCGPEGPEIALDGKAVERLLATGSLVREGDRLRIPASRLFISDSIIRELV